MISQTQYEIDYRTMKAGMFPLSKEDELKLYVGCQRNPWLKDGGYDFEEDPYLEADSPYTFVEIKDISILERFFKHGNWSIRQGVVYKDLAFVNQVNGGDEWCTFKNTNKGWIDFESITFRTIIERGEFTEFIQRMIDATLSQCKSLDY